MDKDSEEALVQARKYIDIASMHIDRVSTKGLGFELGKPLNILFKELQAARFLLYAYTGEKSVKELEEDLDGLGISQPASTRAYINMNT